MEKFFHKQIHRHAVESKADLSAHETKLRLVVLGASGVGKSQIVSRLIGRPYTESYLPTVEDFHQVKYLIDGHTYRLEIVDMSGQSFSPALNHLTILTGDFFLVVYSVAERDTWVTAKETVAMIEETVGDPVRTYRCLAKNFKNVIADRGLDICEQIERHPFNHSVSSNYSSRVAIFIVGNKSDLPNAKVTDDEVIKWIGNRQHVQHISLERFNTSAKTNFMIQKLYDLLFTSTNLPIQLSPDRHRNVAKEEYASESSGSSSHDKGAKDQRHATSAPNSAHHTAIASVLSNERRPCTEDEVLLAVAKMLSIAHDAEIKTHEKTPIKNHVRKITKMFMH